MESDSDSSYNNLYNQSNSEKDALAEAIMTIPTTYAQQGQHVANSTNNNSFNDSLEDHPQVGDGSIAMQVTSEMLSKAINVVEGDHNLYFDKVWKFLKNYYFLALDSFTFLFSIYWPY